VSETPFGLSAQELLLLGSGGVAALTVPVLWLAFRALELAKETNSEHQGLVRLFIYAASGFMGLTFAMQVLAFFQGPSSSGLGLDRKGLAGSTWVSHWAGERWLTKWHFTAAEGEDRWVMRGTTFRIDERFQGQTLFEWSSEPFEWTPGETLRMKGKRDGLETVYEFEPGIALLGKYRGPNETEGSDLHLIATSAGDVRIVPSVPECPRTGE